MQAKKKWRNNIYTPQKKKKNGGLTRVYELFRIYTIYNTVNSSLHIYTQFCKQCKGLNQG